MHQLQKALCRLKTKPNQTCNYKQQQQKPCPYCNVPYRLLILHNGSLNIIIILPTIDISETPKGVQYILPAQLSLNRSNNHNK